MSRKHTKPGTDETHKLLVYLALAFAGAAALVATLPSPSQVLF
jgi:hypothetical protein